LLKNVSAARASSVALLLVASLACAAPARSPTLRAEFQRIEPCPATGQPRGPCPGYQVDHAVPLCLGGAGVDIISNLQWLSVEDHKRKTVRDVDLCRQARRTL
jgi:hypothetical protein